ncbi:ATP-dependent helicase [Clostridium sp. BJN0001]|uniref:ATP-dependent helicase n=1 Tax=Clostridium sp. BJN0001 TaxID=2930219 RepID=UPI001FD585DC|nr:ATP-dependent helicase [Clostridium sp. BJN0001]
MKINLDKYQINAVKTENRNSLIIAAPGSGKTTVIINRVNYLIDKKKVFLGNIIVITFTRAASIDMKSRYKDKFKRDSSPFFGTFHGLFYKILIRDGLNIKIIDEHIKIKIIGNVLSEYFDDSAKDKIKDVLNNISLYKTSGEDFSKFKPSISKEIFEKCLNTYEEYKNAKGEFDFDDLAIKAIDLLKKNESLRNGYKKLFKYILVDEFQDCDQLQIEFLKLMNDEKNSLFAVGDEDQCIYSFRGSKPEYMVTFDKIFSDAKKYYLSINYRSKKNIIEFSKNLISYNKERNDKKIIANNIQDGTVRWIQTFNEHSESDNISSIIKKYYDKGILYSKNAVLYRTNSESLSIIGSFIRNKIKFCLLDKGYNFFEHFIAKDIVSYLKLSIDNYDIDSFIRIINKPFRYISKENINYVRNYMERKSPFDILLEKNDIQPFLKKAISDFNKDINYLNKISLSSAIQYILSDLKYMEYLKNYSEKFKQDFEECEEIVEEFKSAAEGFSTIFELLEYIDNFKKEIEKNRRKKPEDGVILGTIHSVKGMEFNNVYIINVCEDTIPYYSFKNNDIEEERRLFYVGITRSIDNLYVYSPKNRSGNFKDASRFIKEARLDRLKFDTYGFKKGDKVMHQTFKNGLVEEIDNGKITIKFDKGITRSFNLDILMTNSLLKKD